MNKGVIKIDFRILIILSMLLLSSTLFFGCTDTTTETPTQETPTQIIQDISAEEAHSLIEDNRGNPNFLIIDVRTPDEYASGYIENSILIDVNGDDFEAKIGELDKDSKYLVYCKSGGRSRSAVKYMQEQGFKEVYNMLGGIVGWTTAGLPTVK